MKGQIRFPGSGFSLKIILSSISFDAVSARAARALYLHVLYI